MMIIPNLTKKITARDGSIIEVSDWHLRCMLYKAKYMIIKKYLKEILQLLRFIVTNYNKSHFQ